MAQCNYSFQFQGSAQALLNAAQQKIKEYGTLTGDTSSGTFKAKEFIASVSGTYTIIGQTLTVAFDSNVIPCSTIQGHIQSFLNSNALA